MSLFYKQHLMRKAISVFTGLFLCTGSLLCAQPPANDECSGAIFISTPSFAGDNTGASQSQPAINCEGDVSSVANDVWYYFVPAASGMVNIEVDDVSIDAVWEAFSGTCGNLTSLDCADQNPPLAFAATAGETYYLRVYGYDGDEAPFTITITGTPLPVAMSKLVAVVNERGRGQLSWSTSAEQNNKGFSIQRAFDGANFWSIGWLDSRAAGGNSKEQLTYLYEDPDMLTETVFYRLLQTDFDGETTYSNTVMLAASRNRTLTIRAAADPVDGKLRVFINGAQDTEAVITIFDLSGKSIVQFPVTTPQMNIDISTYPKGIYLLQYRDSHTVRTIKINR